MDTKLQAALDALQLLRSEININVISGQKVITDAQTALIPLAEDLRIVDLAIQRVNAAIA